MANTVFRNAMGHVREEKGISSINTDTMAFSTPPSLRATSPIAHSCAEEEVNAFLLNCLCFLLLLRF